MLLLNNYSRIHRNAPGESRAIRHYPGFNPAMSLSKHMAKERYRKWVHFPKGTMRSAHKLFQSNVYVIPVTRAKIGYLADATRESASRVMAEFEHDDIIVMKGRKIEIRKKETFMMISANG